MMISFLRGLLEQLQGVDPEEWFRLQKRVCKLLTRISACILQDQKAKQLADQILSSSLSEGLQEESFGLVYERVKKHFGTTSKMGVKYMESQSPNKKHVTSQIINKNLEYFKRDRVRISQEVRDQKIQALFTSQSPVLPNLECIGCSQVLLANSFPERAVQPYIIISSTQDSYKLQAELLRCCCCLLNAGGGYLFLSNLSSDELNQHPRLVGHRSNDSPDAREWKQFLNSRKQLFEPNYGSFQFDCQLVRVLRKHFYQLDQSPDLDDLYVMRISVIREDNLWGEVTFLSFSPKGYQKSYELYVGHGKEQNRVRGEALYETMHYFRNSVNRKRLAMKLPMTSCHSISCCKYYPLINQLTISTSKQQPIIEKMSEDEQFINAYRYFSILIVSSQKYSKLIDPLKRYFIESKFATKVFLPFEDYRPNSGRKIWAINHHEPFDQILKATKKIDVDKRLSLIFVTTVIYCYNDCEEACNLALWDNYRHVMKKKFNEKVHAVPSDYVTKDNKNIRVTILSLSSLKKSLFSFLFFDNNGIRGEFKKKSVYPAY